MLERGDTWLGRAMQLLEECEKLMLLAVTIRNGVNMLEGAYD